VTFSDPTRSLIDSDPGPFLARFYRLREAEAVEPARYLLGLGGAGPLSTGVRFFNQTITDGSQNLLLVRRTSPGDAELLEPAGRWGGDTVNFIHQGSVPEAEIDPANGLQRGTRVRFSVYARENRFWKFDHHGTTSELWSSLSTTNVCSISYQLRRIVPDYAQPERSWMFFTTPGPSGACIAFPDDTRMLGLRLSMTGDDAPLSVPLPLAPVYDAQGGLSGLIVQDGPRIQAVDAQFANPQNLFSVPNAPLVLNGVTNYTTYTRGFLFGRSAPGRWLYLAVHENLPEYLMGYDLAARRGPVPLIRLTSTSGIGTPTTLFQDWTDTDGSDVYLAVNSGLSTSTIVRIDEDLVLHTVGSLPVIAHELALSARHVVVRNGKRFFSLPKTGGASRELVTVPADEDLAPQFRMRRAARTVEHPTVRQRQFITGGDLIWFETVRARTSPNRTIVYSIAADGSEAAPTRLEDRSIVTWAAPAAVPWCVEGPAHAIYLAPHWTPTPLNLRADFADQPIVAFAAADRSLLFELGRFPALPMRVGNQTVLTQISKSSMSGEPLQFGEAGLLPIRGRPQTTAGTSSGFDLLYFKSDQPGLIPVTHYGID